MGFKQCRLRCSFDRMIILLCLGLSLIMLEGCNRASEAHPEPSAKSHPDKTYFLSEDSDGDGIPDAAELGSFDDRENFRRWFTAIAEMQFYRLSGKWDEQQRDCAGLVRFAWRESLRKHDRLWFQSMGEGYEGIAPDIRTYALENNPLGEKLFRVDFGSFRESDLAANLFTEYADVRTIKNYNTVFVSHNRKDARPGDLLFYHQPWVQKFPYHVMIFLGEARQGGEGANDWVVYHTGPWPSGEGEVRKVRL